MMDRHAFLTHLSIETTTLEVWLEQEWLVPQQAHTEPQFSDADLARARLIQHLGSGMGVNDAGIDVILHLLDQLHGMRRAFAGLNESFGETRPG